MVSELEGGMQGEMGTSGYLDSNDTTYGSIFFPAKVKSGVL